MTIQPNAKSEMGTFDRRIVVGDAILSGVSGIAALLGGLEWPPAVLIALSVGASAFVVRWALAGRNTGVRAAVGEDIDADAGHFIENLRPLISALDLPAFVIADANDIVCHNARARELYPRIMDGRPLYQVSRTPGLLETIRQVRESGIAQSAEVSDRTIDGRRLRVSVAPLRSTTNGEVSPGDGLGFMLVQFNDLSEQDRLAQLRSDFIANASHELRTPLASLIGFIETLQGPASNDPAARMRFLNIMQAQASRMARILDDLLSLSRIEMRAYVRPKDEVDVGGAVRAAVQGLEPIATATSIALQLHLPKEPSQVCGDRDELEQVFQNLIQNAIKYGKEGGKVDVTVRCVPVSGGKANKVIVAIADDGPGIAEEHLPRLTERFYRVDTATSRERGGTGLGLAIVKHILNRHRGELDIKSEVGKGSTFTVVLDALPGRHAG
jgi:two-component system phosphate regulon sensor histidine kinase PhoR